MDDDAQMVAIDKDQLARMRGEYGPEKDGCGDLDFDWLDDGWLTLLRRWLNDAQRAGVSEPNAMVLATVADGKPVTRSVLCKILDESGVAFFTSYTSAKGEQLAVTPYASATFPWYQLGRQAHVQGPVSKVSTEEIFTYWSMRPRGAQLGAWASQQSRPVGSRAHEVVVFGTSQSATIATFEMRYLQSLPAHLRPGLDELSFTLTGNPNRPDGGILTRFGFSIPQLGFTLSGATPADAYPTVDYAFQYDGVNDFPKYPLNVFATANAIAGILFLHSGLIALPPDLASGVVQPVSSPDVLTTYILLPSQDLPLLVPLRAIPLLGNPLADLIQPDLRVLVELGYDRTAHQDVPSPFGLFPDVDWAEVAADLQQGAVQGVNDALSGLGLPPPWQPALPRLF